jgi:hypothetical protein
MADGWGSVTIVTQSGRRASSAASDRYNPPLGVLVPLRLRSISLFLALFLSGQTVFAQARPPATTPACFEETEFCVRPGPLLDFFRAKGGPTVVGYPVSRPFTLRGEEVQLFQRLALRTLPDGPAAPLPLLQDNLLPLRRVAGTPLPPVDANLVDRTPSFSEPDFKRAANAFLDETVPDVFNEEPIDFLELYRQVPGGAESASEGIPVFGWPVSAATLAPDGTAVMQRFEFALFRYSLVTGQNEILLLGDMLKSVITGEGLSDELAADAAGKPLFRQYNPGTADGLHRPAELIDTDLDGAFRPDLGEESGSSGWAAHPGAHRGWPAASNGSQADSPGQGDYAVPIGAAGTLARGASAATSNLQTLGDFELTVDARLAETGRAGYALYLRQRSPDERYALLVDAAQRLVAFYQRVGGTTRVLWDWSPAPALRGGTETNRLMVRAEGNRFTAWVNGSRLFELEATGPSDGTIWLGALTWDQPNSAIFSNLQIATPD